MKLTQEITEFVTRIRNSSEGVRMRWLVISSAATMVLVMGMWALYEHTVYGSGGDAGTAEVSGNVQVGVGEALAAGAKVVARRVVRGAEKVETIIQGTLGATNSFTIKPNPAPTNFNAKGIETIPKTKLP